MFVRDGIVLLFAQAELDHLDLEGEVLAVDGRMDVSRYCGSRHSPNRGKGAGKEGVGGIEEICATKTSTYENTLHWKRLPDCRRNRSDWRAGGET